MARYKTLKVKLDHNRSQTYPWKDYEEQPGTTDSNCSNYGTSFLRKGTGKQVALASLPQSGELWLRYLIEGLTGVYTGDLYMVIIKAARVNAS